jgi:hypothetical protein
MYRHLHQYIRLVRGHHVRGTPWKFISSRMVTSLISSSSNHRGEMLLIFVWFSSVYFGLAILAAAQDGNWAGVAGADR